MDISSSRRNLLTLACLGWIINLVGCTDVSVARIWVSLPAQGQDISEEIKKMLAASEWEISERYERDKEKYGLKNSEKVFTSTQSVLRGYTIVLAADDSGNVELALRIGNDRFSEEAVIAFQTLVNQFKARFGTSVRHDRQTNRGQVLYTR